MKLNKVLLGVTLSAVTLGVIAAEPAPVIDVSNSQSSSSSSLSLTEQYANLERKLEASNRRLISNQRQLDELLNEVNELRGVTELHTHQLSQILNRQRELYQELDRRVVAALKPTPNEPVVTVNNTTASAQVNYSQDLTENEAYDRAVNMVLKDKRYEEAIPAFRAFNQKYPNSSYAANAHYWLGQLLFNKGKLAEARVEFTDVMTNYTKSSKRSDAILKLAMVEQKEKNNTKAVNLYQVLIKEYPNSSSAKLAKARLANLSQ
jgi:tol-pal system protein YbgF